MVLTLKRMHQEEAALLEESPNFPETPGWGERELYGQVRQTPRVDARMRVCFGPDSRLLSGFSINLSSGGLFLVTDIPLKVDAPLALEFELPDSGHKIRCRGRVAWVNHPENLLKNDFPPGIGVQFLNLSLDQMEALREFVRKNLLSPAW